MLPPIFPAGPASGLSLNPISSKRTSQTPQIWVRALRHTILELPVFFPGEPLTVCHYISGVLQIWFRDRVISSTWKFTRNANDWASLWTYWVRNGGWAPNPCFHKPFGGFRRTLRFGSQHYIVIPLANRSTSCLPDLNENSMSLVPGKEQALNNILLSEWINKCALHVLVGRELNKAKLRNVALVWAPAACAPQTPLANSQLGPA